MMNIFNELQCLHSTVQVTAKELSNSLNNPLNGGQFCVQQQQQQQLTKEFLSTKLLENRTLNVRILLSDDSSMTYYLYLMIQV